jgi:hypothetical protein
MPRRIALIATLLLLALSASAGAQSSPFGPLPAAQPTPTPTVATPSSSDNNTGRNVLFAIGGALLVGFGVMGWFIMRDARGAIPQAELAGPRLREQGSHMHRKQAKAKARAKTRAQRAARKAHRKR